MRDYSHLSIEDLSKRTILPFHLVEYQKQTVQMQQKYINVEFVQHSICSSC